MIILHRALKDARDGEMPPFTPESLVRSLGLEVENPDNLDLMDRFERFFELFLQDVLRGAVKVHFDVFNQNFQPIGGGLFCDTSDVRGY